ncbi:hypothetical protein KUCAC02_007062 [Chaenocephalus aceratus]|nr:hypothetical protein KUCAC02_007062 [Chaenocephalus aceratus]
MSAPSNSLQQPRDKSSSCRLHPIRATVPCQPHAGVVEPRTAEAPVPLPGITHFRNVEGISHELENVFIREDWEQGIQAMDVVDGRRISFQRAVRQRITMMPLLLSPLMPLQGLVV